MPVCKRNAFIIFAEEIFTCKKSFGKFITAVDDAIAIFIRSAPMWLRVNGTNRTRTTRFYHLHKIVLHSPCVAERFGKPAYSLLGIT